MANYIDRQAAIDALTEYGNGRAVYISVEEAFRRIEQLLSAQPEIVRCKDCKYHGYNECLHEFGLIAALDNHYCSYAERRES